MSEKFVWDVTVSRFGLVKVIAETEDDAMKKADAIPESEVSWDDDWKPTDAYCLDSIPEKLIFEVYTENHEVSTLAFEKFLEGCLKEDAFDHFEQVARLVYQDPESGQNVLVELDVPTGPPDSAYLCAYTYEGEFENYSAEYEVYCDNFEGKFEDIREIMLKIARGAFGITIKEAIEDDSFEFEEFKAELLKSDIGEWEKVNSADTIFDYIEEKMREGVLVSHILATIETRSAKHDLWNIWLGNSMEEPEPINSKQDLCNALGLNNLDLQKRIVKK